MKKEDFDSWKLMHSYNNYVYLVKKGNEEYILKHNVKERAALKLWRDKLPVPKIIEEGKDFLLLEKLPGQVARKYTNKKFYQELGHILGKIHSYKPTSKGDLITYPKQFWNEKLYDIKGYCHGDTALNNYLVDKGVITGVLDWEFAGEGEIIKDTFKSMKSFFDKFEYRKEIYKTHKENLSFPDNWEKVALVQQWIQFKKILTKIDDMKWKELNKEETLKRRKQVVIKWTENIKKIEELYKTI